jgi:hypothetical protein
MFYSRQELDRKPLALLQMLARQQGVPLSEKVAIIDGLMKKGSYSYSPSSYSCYAPSSLTPSSYSASSPFSSAGSGDNAMSLGQLRALAKERGMRGDTKAELVNFSSSISISISI